MRSIERYCLEKKIQEIEKKKEEKENKTAHTKGMTWDCADEVL